MDGDVASPSDVDALADGVEAESGTVDATSTAGAELAVDGGGSQL